MTNIIPRTLAALLMGGTLLVASAPALAAQGDCCQPTSNGGNCAASDALTILKESVGQTTACEAKPCICDVNSNGSIQASDALLTLKKAVGQNVEVTCTTGSCGGSDDPACTSAEFQSRTGSDLDSGWTGIAHDSDLILGASITFRTLRKCSDNQAPCEQDSDCGSNNCVPTCNCNDDVTCEITGPTHGKNCLTTLDDCEANRCQLGATTQATACTTNADCTGGAVCTGSTSCANGIACVSTFGPPLPLSSGGTPVCVVSVFDGPLTGTANSATGEALTASNLKSRVFLGITLDKPCPRCGSPAQTPEIGDQFTCDGGPSNGQACTVDGVSPVFGGTSFDCQPDTQANVSGAGLAIRFNEVTTGTSTKTAQLPCGNSSFRSNPMFPLDVCIGGSNNGNACTINANCPSGFCNLPKCLDSGERCTSNADCTRCTEDSSIECSNNSDCTGNGSCAESPDQPVTCGYWCQCGFCEGNASLPCFQDSDCPAEQQCEVGPGTGVQQNVPQQKPNDCAGDKFICGGLVEEECATTTQGECSEQPYRSCTEGSTTCEQNNAGFCVVTPRKCFESRISRTGDPSPLGKYCAFEVKSCNTNADCTQEGDFCASDASRPETVALFCVPGTSSSSINSVGGITGPGAVRLNGFIQVCRCGDSVIGCDEECDDGNATNGDGCDDYCQDE